MIHQANIIIHVLAGAIALVIGVLAIVYNRRVARHRKLGRYFMYLLVVVVSTGFIGFLFFRHDPFLLILTLIAGYVGYAGFRNIALREQRSDSVDVAIAIGCGGTGVVYGIYLLIQGTLPNPPVVLSTIGALVFVTGYDLIKHFFFHPHLKNWWLYEHIYKMVSAFSAMLSAFAGNVLRDYHPYSQIGPSALSMMVIVYFIWRRASSRPSHSLSGS